MSYRTIWTSCLCCILALTIAATSSSAQNQNPRDQPNQPGNRPETTPTPPSTTAPGQQGRPATTSSDDDSFLSKALEINAAEVELGRLAATKAQNKRVKDYANMLVKDQSAALEKLHRAHRNTSTGTVTDKSGASTRETSRGQSGTTTGQPGASTRQPGTTTGQTGPATDPGGAGTRESSRGQSGTTPGQPGGVAAGQRQPKTVGSAGDVPLSAEHEQLRTRLSGLSGAQFDREYIDAMVAGHREAVGVFEKQTGAAKSTDADTTKLAQELLPTIKRHLQQAEQIQKSLSTPAK